MSLLLYQARRQSSSDRSNNADSLTEEEMEDLVRRRLVNRFRLHTNVKEASEALYYLELAEFDFDYAITLFNEDLAWETQNGHLFANSKANSRHHHQQHHHNNHPRNGPTSAVQTGNGSINGVAASSSKVDYSQQRTGCFWFS